MNIYNIRLFLFQKIFLKLDKSNILYLPVLVSLHNSHKTNTSGLTERFCSGSTCLRQRVSLEVSCTPTLCTLAPALPSMKEKVNSAIDLEVT